MCYFSDVYHEKTSSFFIDDFSIQISQTFMRSSGISMDFPACHVENYWRVYQAIKMCGWEALNS
jgi:hypothetical protein